MRARSAGLRVATTKASSSQCFHQPPALVALLHTPPLGLKGCLNRKRRHRPQDFADNRLLDTAPAEAQATLLAIVLAAAAANRHRSKSAAPSLWALLDRLGREHWPRLVRGDKDWGSEANMASCEGAGLDYLFKLRLTKGARRLASRLMARDEWEDAGQGWSGCEAELRRRGRSTSAATVTGSRSRSRRGRHTGSTSKAQERLEASPQPLNPLAAAGIETTNSVISRRAWRKNDARLHGTTESLQP